MLDAQHETQMPCPRCGSGNIQGPMALLNSDPLYPGRVLRCRGCWHDFKVHTPEKGREVHETTMLRNTAALAAFRKALPLEMTPIPGLADRNGP